jgi:hypothetical protein
MLVALNYANKAYKKHQKLNTKTAYLFGKVDKVYSFSPEDIDIDFYEKNKNILSEKRGNGLWLWKPYFILKVLNEINDGDYLVYLDSGAFYIRNVHSLIQRLKSTNQDMMLFETPLIESQWTKKGVFIAMNTYTEGIRFSNQMMATVIIMIKSEYSLNFVNKWLRLCQQENLIFPKDKGSCDDFMYIAHREDQSILSVLAKKEGIVPFSDPTDYGKFPTKYIRIKRFFQINTQQDSHKIKKTYFLSIRESNALYCLIMYFIRYFLSKFRLYILKY